LQLIILCTRPSIFQAAKQSVAAKYLPTYPRRQNCNTSHIEACIAAAVEIAKLIQQLLLTKQTAVLFDYHFPFNAAIVLQINSLLDGQVEHTNSINTMVSYLQKAGQQGNESAADCARIVKEFGDVVARLKSQSQRSCNGIRAESHTRSLGSIVNNIEGQETQDEQAATYEELLSWFTEGLT
jgi:hypothetical protein